MNKIEKKPLKQIGFDFIEPRFIPDGENEYSLRNRQLENWREFRQLTADEIEVLIKNENSADSWNNIHVTDRFNPKLVKNSQFHGLIRIGDLESYYLEFHDIRQPVGIYNSTLISCDIGSNVAISNVNLISHYIVRDEVILRNIHEMVTTDYAKFGCGILKDGEEEAIRIWIEVGNENGGRSVVPFNRMLPGDAWIWSRYRDRTKLMDAFLEMTQREGDSRRGYYGTIGARSVLKHCRTLKDVHVGSDAYIKGSNKLKNLTINSSADSPTQIGEGVELVNGIVGLGCHIFYGVKAVRFIMDDYTNLKYGARLINSYLGSNSTISCCEVLNSLIFPGHEQHHNSSFLCASTIYGQSNMASGATVGSNHNSRGNDGEIMAGRGFWPGLCTSLKHNSLFSSFNLLAKGSYPSEIHNPLPFSLLSNKEEGLSILPAYWFTYNMYALARNAWKYGARDKRIEKRQPLEFDYLAPDTVDEILHAMGLIREWAAASPAYEEFRRKTGSGGVHRFLLEEFLPALPADHLERGKRPVTILKPSEAYRRYRDAVLLYAVRTLVVQGGGLQKGLAEARADYASRPSSSSPWLNVGGQLIPEDALMTLLDKIEAKRIRRWEGVHDFYKEEGEKYPRRLWNHALACLRSLSTLDGEEGLDWENLIRRGIAVQKDMAGKTRESREKDYDNAFRNMTFANLEERDAVIGPLEENAFILHIAEEARRFEEAALQFLRK